jgi:hypothetical protein
MPLITLKCSDFLTFWQNQGFLKQKYTYLGIPLAPNVACKEILLDTAALPCILINLHKTIYRKDAHNLLVKLSPKRNNIDTF